MQTKDIAPTETLQILTAEIPITTVTVLEDRAKVRREGKIQLTPGQWRIQIEKVAPVLSDKSLRAEYCQNYAGARIDDVRIRRQILVKDTDKPEEIRTLQTQLRSLIKDFQTKTENRHHTQSCFEKINSILTKALQELPEDAAWGQTDPKTWREQLSGLFKQLRDFRLEILDSYHEQEKLSEEINNLLVKLNAIQRPDSFYIAKIEADINVLEAGEYAIAFDYVVPCALWRPWHQARLLLTEKPKVLFRVEGCVWQRTGENWNNVDLVLSTARASLGTEPPLLTDDVLQVMGKSTEIRVQTREETIQKAGLGAGEASPTADIPGVDDGGEVRNLRPATQVTIPSDGRPYRVPIFSFESEVDLEWVLMPEVSTAVVLKTELINTSAFPILAGPVDLLRTSGFVGRTGVLFIAPGEKFALGWGADGTVPVRRLTTDKREQNHLTRWHTVTNTVQLYLSNIGEETREISVTERVPVSELEQVKIEVISDKTTDQATADENGFVRWKFTLEPYSNFLASLVYKISYAPEVKGI